MRACTQGRIDIWQRAFIHVRVEFTPPYICMKTGAKGTLRDR